MAKTGRPRGRPPGSRNKPKPEVTFELPDDTEMRRVSVPVITVTLDGASEADAVRVYSTLLLTVPPMMPEHVAVTIEQG